MKTDCGGFYYICHHCPSHKHKIVATGNICVFLFDKFVGIFFHSY